MRSNTPAVFALAAALSFAWLACLAPSRAYAAGDKAVAPEVRRQASALFARGEALYRVGDHARAAALFEEAYRLAPHPDILWNAARSYDRAGDNARAANAYAAYLAASEETAPDRKDATRALERLSRKLGRIEVHAAPEASVFIDGAPVSTPTVYVSPGSHAFRTVVNGREEQQTVVIEAGSTRSFSALASAPPPPLVAPAAPPAVVSAPPAPPAASATTRPSSGWSPLVFAGSATLSAVATGFAIGFGVDTLNERSRFDASPSQAAFDDGRDKQARTNVAIGVAAGLWAITAVTGLWLVDWKGGRAGRAAGGAGRPASSVGLLVSPGLIGACGAFQ